MSHLIFAISGTETLVNKGIHYDDDGTFIWLNRKRQAYNVLKLNEANETATVMSHINAVFTHTKAVSKSTVK